MDQASSARSVKAGTNRLASGGRIFAGITALIYVIFTLLPDSHSLMVQWPWVLIWQVGVIAPAIWWWLQGCSQRRWPGFGFLGNGLIGCGLLGILVTIVAAIFPDQAYWYGLGALGAIAGLLAVRGWLVAGGRWQRLLWFQGVLSTACLLESLLLWGLQTWWPEMQRLRSLNAQGLDVSYDFNLLELRNWAPFGHQNYVAGYVLIVLPLLVGLGLSQRRWQRWLWGCAALLGILTLYTTSSRGGWMGLGVAVLSAIIALIGRSQLSRWRLGVIFIGSIATLAILAGLNQRLWSFFDTVLQGGGSRELAFRFINGVVGWNMGSDRPFTGIGLGGVPLLYQHYRPAWAGREAELVYQLHSTPFQLWAELGIWGLLIFVGAGVWLLWQFGRWLGGQSANSVPLTPDTATALTTQERNGTDGLNSKAHLPLIQGSLFCGLLAYFAFSLTDYQLDNVAIVGSLVIQVNILWHLLTPSAPIPAPHPQRRLKLELILGTIVLIASLVIITPIHRAWYLSNQGFQALQQKEFTQFQAWLSQAHQTASWEPYYPFQLGMNLGYLSEQASTEEQKAQLQAEAITWLTMGIERSAYQEFGYHNLGWLLLKDDPAAATPILARAARLMPAKHGAWFGLGWSLLAQNKTELAIAAFRIEALRDPSLIANPLWRSPERREVRQQLLNQLDKTYQQWLEDPELTSADWQAFVQHRLAVVYWWQGKLPEAKALFAKSQSRLEMLLMELAETGSVPAEVLAQNPTGSALVIQAWLQPDQRPQLLERAWLAATQQPLAPELRQSLLESMAQADTFEQWLKWRSPARTYRRQRAGFNVLSRHVDGPAPSDFYPIVENIAVTVWFKELFWTLPYAPMLDNLLQPERDELLLRSFSDIEVSQSSPLSPLP